MKTNDPFHSIRSHWITTFLLAAAALAFTLNTQGAKDTPLCLEFRDDPSDKIRSDGGGAYCQNLAANLAVHLHSNLYFDWATSDDTTQPPTRLVVMGFSAPEVFPGDLLDPPGVSQFYRRHGLGHG